MNVTIMYMYIVANRWIIILFKFKFQVRLEEHLALPKVTEEWLSGPVFAPVLSPFDHRLTSHGTKSSLLSN